MSLVRQAVKLRDRSESDARRYGDSFLRYDHVWCVSDVDQHAHLAAATELARQKKIDLAISNPCFEIWPLLHFAKQTAHISVAQAQELLARHMPGYEKTLACELLAGNYELAAQRALTLDAMHVDNRSTDTNPSTGVVHLMQALLKAAAESSPRDLGTPLFA